MGDAQAGGAGRLRGRLPASADGGEEAAAHRRRLVDRRLAVEAVEADRRGAEQRRAADAGSAARARASVAVPWTRLSRISAMRCGVQRRSATPAPARWITASSGGTRSGAGKPRPRIPGTRRRARRRPAPRTKRTTRWPPVVRKCVSAVPTSPDAPVMPTVSRGRSATRACAARSAAQRLVAIAEQRGQPRGHGATGDRPGRPVRPGRRSRCGPRGSTPPVRPRPSRGRGPSARTGRRSARRRSRAAGRRRGARRPSAGAAARTAPPA